MAQNFHNSLTWYEATAHRSGFAALDGDASADVVVVGGGLAGLTCAVQLARRGKSVVMLEASRIAWAASGRNGGFVSSGFAEGFEKIKTRIGVGAARALHELSQRGVEFIRTTIATHDPSLKMGDGSLVAHRFDDSGAMQRYCEDATRNLKEDIRYLDRTKLSEHVRNDVYCGAAFNRGAFHIHPLRYALLLARLAKENGARIMEQSKALRVERHNQDWCVMTGSGTVTARDVIYCVSSLDRSLHRATAPAVLPVATYVAVTEPLQQDVIRTRASISDTRRAGDYYRLVSDDRILWGGRITTRLSEPSHLAERMKGDMTSLYPSLHKARIDYAWAGLMGYALHKMPLIGTDGQGQWFATAFGGHGLNTTAMAGELLATAICDGDDTYRRFAPFAPQWALGQLGRAGVQGTYWWMRLRDRFDESFKRIS
jgi:gamma-glutamylputrescine oxidase